MAAWRWRLIILSAPVTINIDRSSLDREKALSTMSGRHLAFMCNLEIHEHRFLVKQKCELEGCGKEERIELKLASRLDTGFRRTYAVSGLSLEFLSRTTHYKECRPSLYNNLLSPCTHCICQSSSSRRDSKI